MDASRIILPKRRFLAGRRIWVFSVIIIIALIGTSIQMKMTWGRERLRGITSDAVDFMNVAKTGLVSVIPPKSEFEPFIQLFNEATQGQPAPVVDSTTESAPITPIPPTH